MPKKVVARQITRQLPSGYVATRGIIHQAQYDHFIVGLLIGHSSQKDCYQLRTLVFPLMVDFGFMHIGYSTQWYNDFLANPADYSPYYFPGTSAEIAAQMLSVIAKHDLAPDVHKPYGPADFLAQHGTRRPHHPPSRDIADSGACAALLNDIPHARWCFDRTQAYLLERLEDVVGAENEQHLKSRLAQLEAAVDVLDKGQPAIAEHFRQASLRVAASLRFPRSTSEPVQA